MRPATRGFSKPPRRLGTSWERQPLGPLVGASVSQPHPKAVWAPSHQSSRQCTKINICKDFRSSVPRKEQRPNIYFLFYRWVRVFTIRGEWNTLLPPHDGPCVAHTHTRTYTAYTRAHLPTYTRTHTHVHTHAHATHTRAHPCVYTHATHVYEHIHTT